MFTSIIIINSCLDSGSTLHVSCRTYSLTCLSSAVIVIGVSLILNREEFSSWCVLVEIIDRAIVRRNFQQFRRCKEVLGLSRILSGNFTMVGNFEWTLGGNCVNTGCTPMKMMHYAGKLAESRLDQQRSGYPMDMSAKHDWKTLVDNI